jgi:putative ABC transport system permease protein
MTLMPERTVGPAVAPAAARLRPSDLAGLASIGLRTRKLRASLSALGIAIGVAAIVAVLGLAASSKTLLLAEIARLGTNLLTVTNGQTFAGQTAELPDASPGMVGQLPGVTSVQYTGTTSADVYRNPLVPSIDTDGLGVQAASLNLPAVVGTSVLVGFPAAQKYLGFDGHPSELYVRTVNTQAAATAVDNLLGAQSNPENPSEVNVSQPSQALTAQADAAGAFDALFLGLGAVALLVGAVGVANIMVISVLERRQEIGLRRALGATKGQIRIQFLSEAILLALTGGVAGVILGAICTAVYAHIKGWPVVIPPEAWAGGLAAAIGIGALAGLLPAIRAARLSPTQALWSL